jgi:L-cystine uptake protein TcyP (sodium:dicarboxylate symporter family)
MHQAGAIIHAQVAPYRNNPPVDAAAQAEKLDAENDDRENEAARVGVAVQGVGCVGVVPACTACVVATASPQSRRRF